MKKAIIMGAVLAAAISCQFSSSAHAPNKPNRIIDTVRITANPVVLVAHEVTKTANWDTDVSDTTISLSQQDAQALMKIAFAEGGNQSVEGQRKIMEVVYNRVLSDEFPNSISAVIAQKGQFESYSNGSYEKAEPNADTHIALAEFESRKDYDSDIIAFETSVNHKSLERYFRFLYTAEDHDFYGFRK